MHVFQIFGGLGFASRFTKLLSSFFCNFLASFFCRPKRLLQKIANKKFTKSDVNLQAKPIIFLTKFLTDAIQTIKEILNRDFWKISIIMIKFHRKKEKTRVNCAIFLTLYSMEGKPKNQKNCEVSICIFLLTWL